MKKVSRRYFNTALAAGLLGSFYFDKFQKVLAAQTSTRNVPVGIYSIDDASLLSKDYVDGVLVRAGWAQCESTQGKYNFASITNAITQATKYNKKVTIALLTFKSPSWLTNDPSIETINGMNGKVPAPWDTKALGLFTKLISALANTTVGGYKISQHPNVANINTTILGVDSIRLVNPPANYSASKFQTAILNSMAAWRSNFPARTGQYYYVGLFAISGSTGITDTQNMRDAILAKYPDTNFYQELLTGASPSGALFNMLDQVKSKTGIMFQWCGAVSQQNQWTQCYWSKDSNGVNNDTPGKGFSHGYYDLSAKYFECYAVDLKNAAYTSDYTTWHKTIHS